MTTSTDTVAPPRGRWLAWSSATSGANYCPQLDGLRALAIAGVLYSHFFDVQSPAGTLGVLLFFVLSGYLITGMLLDAKRTGPVSLRNFYVRRALRLWPAYYLVLGITVILNVEGIRSVAWWHAVYASNILFALRGDYVPWVAAAWWSLAVEEQFYLVWPVVVVLASRRALPWICIGTIAGSLVFTAIVQSLHTSEQMNFLLPGLLDYLVGGGLLAFTRQHRPDLLRRLSALGLVAAGLLLAILALGFEWTVWVRLFPLVVCCAVVNLAATNSDWAVGRLLASQPAIFIGRISYGIYLFHGFVWWALMQVSGSHPALQRAGGFVLLVGSVTTVAVAALSWLMIEQPANRLKVGFPLHQRPPAAVSD